MEKESLTPSNKVAKAVSLLKLIIWPLALALPIWGVIHFDGKILAEIELGDPVNLYNDAPLPMSVVHTSLIIGLIACFTPFKHISSLAIGIAVGGFAFYGLDQYDQLKDLSEMGLSTKPLMEMITLTADGEKLITCVALCVITQCLYGIWNPIIQLIKNKNR